MNTLSSMHVSFSTLLVLLSFGITAQAQSSSSSSLEGDVNILLKSLKCTDGNHSGGTPFGAEGCAALGVTCDKAKGSFSVLIENRVCSGVLPSVWPITAQSVSIRNCGLSGTVPLMNTVDSTMMLEVLDLSRNRISGTLPKQLPRKLRILKLGQNVLVGFIDFAALPTQLEVLDLHANSLTVTDVVGGDRMLTALMNLDLSENSISSLRIMDSLNPKVIQSIRLQKNKMSGTIPSLTVYENLLDIDLSDNLLTGTAPALSNTALPAQLKSLKLSENFFTGTLSFGNTFPSLETIIMRHCGLQGVVDFSRMSSTVKYLDVQENSLDLLLHTLPLCCLESLLISGTAIRSPFNASHLPATLQALWANSIMFTGELDVRRLPPNIVNVSLSANNLQILKNFPEFLGQMVKYFDVGLNYELRNEGPMNFTAMKDNTRLQVLTMNNTKLICTYALADLPRSLLSFDSTSAGLKCDDCKLQDLPPKIKSVIQLWPVWTGYFDTRLLPRSLQNLIIIGNSYNHFQGVFDVADLPEDMRVLQLVDHVLTGNVDILRLPRKMVVFDVTNCSLDGTLPFDRPNVLSDSIRELHLGNNRFVGRIVFSYFPKEMSVLDFSDCKDITGTLDFLDLPKYLEVLGVAGSNLQPTNLDFSNLPRSMLKINLGRNNFTGLIDFRDMPTQMISISLDRANFFGDVSWKDLPRTLEDLDISWNDFTGEVDWVNVPRNLKSLNIGGNNFHGSLSIPDDVHFPEMHEFALLANDFSGELSLNTKKVFSKLTKFRIMDNEFRGPFDVGLFCPDFQEFEADCLGSGNSFEGRLVVPKYNVTIHPLLELSLNMFTSYYDPGNILKGGDSSSHCAAPLCANRTFIITPASRYIFKKFPLTFNVRPTLPCSVGSFTLKFSKLPISVSSVPDTLTWQANDTSTRNVQFSLSDNPTTEVQFTPFISISQSDDAISAEVPVKPYFVLFSTHADRNAICSFAPPPEGYPSPTTTGVLIMWQYYEIQCCMTDIAYRSAISGVRSSILLSTSDSASLVSMPPTLVWKLPADEKTKSYSNCKYFALIGVQEKASILLNVSTRLVTSVDLNTIPKSISVAPRCGFEVIILSNNRNSKCPSFQIQQSSKCAYKHPMKILCTYSDKKFYVFLDAHNSSSAFTYSDIDDNSNVTCQEVNLTTKGNAMTKRYSKETSSLPLPITVAIMCGSTSNPSPGNSTQNTIPLKENVVLSTLNGVVGVMSPFRTGSGEVFQRTILFQVLDCDAGQQLGLPWFLHPTRITIGGSGTRNEYDDVGFYFGAVVGNLIIILSFTCTHLLTCVLVSYHLYKTSLKRWGPSGRTSFIGTAFATIRFPAVSGGVESYFRGVICSSCLVVFTSSLHATLPMRVISLVIFILYCIWCFIFQVLLQRHILADITATHQKEESFEQNRGDDPESADFKWNPKSSTVRQYGIWFSSITLHHLWWYLPLELCLEIAQTIVVAFSVRDLDQCFASLTIFAVVALIQVCVAVVWNPYTKSETRWLSVVCSSCDAIACVVGMVRVYGLLKWDWIRDDPTYVMTSDVAEWIVFISTCIASLVRTKNLVRRGINLCVKKRKAKDNKPSCTTMEEMKDTTPPLTNPAPLDKPLLRRKSNEGNDDDDDAALLGLVKTSSTSLDHLPPKRSRPKSEFRGRRTSINMAEVKKMMNDDLL